MLSKDPPPEGFTDRLREAMTAAGVNQRELAKRLRITEGAVSKWFNEGQAPSLLVLSRIPRVLGVSIDWLVGAPAAPPPPRRPVSKVDQRAVRRLIKALRDAGEAGRQVAASMTDDDEP